MRYTPISRCFIYYHAGFIASCVRVRQFTCAHSLPGFATCASLNIALHCAYMHFIASHCIYCQQVAKKKTTTTTNGRSHGVPQGLSTLHVTICLFNVIQRDHSTKEGGRLQDAENVVFLRVGNLDFMRPMKRRQTAEKHSRSSIKRQKYLLKKVALGELDLGEHALSSNSKEFNQTNRSNREQQWPAKEQIVTLGCGQSSKVASY